MEEPIGAQYAIQVAVHTLKDRCKKLQQRISILEEENVNLRITCSRSEDNDLSLSEIDKLKGQIAELTQQKEQFQVKIKLVTKENQDLWGKLGKLTQVNKNLGNQLHKINDTLSQHASASPTHTALIRSKTFTQDEPHTKILQKNLEENNKISLELEDISLKLINSFTKDKFELESLCTEIEDIKSEENVLITDSFGFCYDDELNDDVLEELKIALQDLRQMKEELSHQKQVLLKNANNVDKIQEQKKCDCDMKKNFLLDKGTSTNELIKVKSIEDKFNEATAYEPNLVLPTKKTNSEVDKICPMCSQNFYKDTDFEVFQQHVEDHFRTETENFELL